MTNDQIPPQPDVPAPELAAQMALGLEVLRQAVSAIQSHVEVLAKQTASCRLESTRTKDSLQSISTRVVLMEKDVVRLDTVVGVLNDLVVTGGNAPPLRERVSLVENRLNDFDDWRSKQDKRAESTESADREQAHKRQEHRHQVILQIAGWVAAFITGIVIAWLSK